MKTLYYLRHSIKGITPETEKYIMRKGLNLAAKLIPKILGNNIPIHFFHGIEIRTLQTLAAAIITRGWGGIIHSPVLEIGGDVTYDRWEELGVNFENEELTGIEMAKVGLGNNYDKEVNYCGSAISNMLNLMNENETGLAIGHGMILEMALEAHGYPALAEKLELNELEGAVITEEQEEILHIQLIRRP